MDRRGFIKAGMAAAVTLASTKLLDASDLLQNVTKTGNKTDKAMRILVLKTSGNKHGSSNTLADEVSDFYT